jgi:hypothetical protein
MPLDLLFDQGSVSIKVATEPWQEHEEVDSTDRVQNLHLPRQA